MKLKKYKIIPIIFVLVLFLVLGIKMRLAENEIFIGNTASFFYTRSEYLNDDAAYMKYDDLSYAPEIQKEDYPPFLAYFTVVPYKIINPFFDIDFYTFANYFPLFIFVLIFLSILFIVSDLYNKTAAIIAAILSAIMPVFITLSNRAYYTEEALGVLLIFWTFYFLIKSKEKKRFTWLTIISLTLLMLTWQVFLIFILGILLLILIRIKSKNILKKYLLILIMPFLIGHIISVYFIDLDYSPVYVVKEFYMGIEKQDSEAFSVAFDRGKLKHMGLERYLDEYTYLGLIFVFLGLLKYFKKIKHEKYYVLFIFTVLSLISIINYIKFRFLAAPFILLSASLGLEAIYNFKYTKLFNKFFEKNKYFILMILMIILGIFYYQYFVMEPKCETELIGPDNMEIGEEYTIEIKVVNKGDDTLCASNAISGLHIEVINATILEKSAYSMFTKSRISEKRFTENNADWFEAIFDCLKSEETVKVILTIMPYELPVKLNYRCWMPSKCLRKPPEGLKEPYRVKWRNEKCLHRAPTEGNYCDVRVFAGYEEKQESNCFTKTYT